MSHALSSREHTNHRRRHCAKRATLHARVAADCTSDAFASASDENSAALELHEPMVPLAWERPPGSLGRLRHKGLSRPLPENWPRRRTGARCRCTVQERSGQQTAPSRSSFPTRHGRPCPHGSVRPPLPDREEVVPGA